MQLHDLKPTHKNRDIKRIGRGGKKGTYCGRGLKGQISRAGANFQPIIRMLVKRYPKLRGYRLKIREENPFIVDVSQLEKKFSDNEIVSTGTLAAKKIIAKFSGAFPVIKILGNAKLTKKLRIADDCQISASARKAVENAGGGIIVIKEAKKTKTFAKVKADKPGQVKTAEEKSISKKEKPKKEKIKKEPGTAKQ